MTMSAPVDINRWMSCAGELSDDTRSKGGGYSQRASGCSSEFSSTVPSREVEQDSGRVADGWELRKRLNIECIRLANSLANV